MPAFPRIGDPRFKIYSEIMIPTEAPQDEVNSAVNCSQVGTSCGELIEKKQLPWARAVWIKLPNVQNGWSDMKHYPNFDPYPNT